MRVSHISGWNGNPATIRPLSNSIGDDIGIEHPSLFLQLKVQIGLVRLSVRT